MIKNVVFDFGQVLVHFEPKYMVGAYVSDKNDMVLLEEVVFDRLYWDRLDAGTIADEEVLSECCKRLPERLWDVARKIYYNWIYNIPEIDGMRELIKYIKKQYSPRVLVLSNISHYFADHKDEIPILKEADGYVFSSKIGVTKPKKEIFDHLCQKFNFSPNEAVFIDDNQSNCEGARALGFTAYQFDGNAKALKDYLDTIL